MKQNTVRFLSALLLICLLLSGCSGANGEYSTDTGEGIRITDALGYEHCIRKKPNRVAALIGSFAEVWQLAGGGDTLVAASKDAFEELGLELEGAVCIGGAHSPNAELIISTRPELVLASASTTSNVELRDTLTAAGIRVIYYDVDCFEDYLSMLSDFTAITGRADLYEKNGEALRQRIEKVKTDLSNGGIPDEQKRILLLRASSSSVKAKGSEGTVLGEMLADIGCTNVADSSTGILEELSIESIVAADPYRIFVVTMGDDTEGAKKAVDTLISESPALSGLSAVKEGRLYVMDKRLYNMKPNGRWADAYEGLYEILTKS